MVNGTVVEQPEYTWQRIQTDRDGCVSFHRAVLDVAGMSVEPFRYVNYTAVSRRIDTIPFPSASDHMPIGIAWQKVRRGKCRGERGAPRMPHVPECVFEDTDFSDKLQEYTRAWSSNRPSGLEALEIFNRDVANMATNILRTKLIQARTTAHKFDVTFGTLDALTIAVGIVA